MIDDVSVWTDLPESEWLTKWLESSERLERTRHELMEPETGITMTDLESAHLDGEIVMLRRVLKSRGI